MTAVVCKPVIKYRTSMFSFVKCMRCLYLDVMAGIGQPNGPSSFGDLMRQKSDQIAFLDGKKLSILGKDFPNGRIVKSNGRFTTCPCEVAGADVVLSGSYDFLIQLENGDYVVASFKNSDPTRNGNIDEYAKQLNAIAFALSNKEKEPIKISALGIFEFSPLSAAAGKDYTEIYKWHNIPLNIDLFKTQLEDITETLMSDNVPEAGKDEKGKICEFCERDIKITDWQNKK